MRKTIWLVLVLLVVRGAWALDGVVHTHVTTAPWETDAFFLAGTSTPAVVTFTIGETENTTIVQVHDGSSWIQVTAPVVVNGTAVRFSAGSCVPIIASYGGDDEEIQPACD
jgi:hypothetical protein